MNEYVIYSKRLANELVSRGFKLIRTELNIKYPKYLVFIFEDSKDLRSFIKER